jgi:predicted DNA-binding protein with PD1-like motif
VKVKRAVLGGQGFVLRVETGEDLLETLQGFVTDEKIRNAVITLVLLPDDLGIATWDRL